MTLKPTSSPAFAPHRNKPCFCGSDERFKDCCGSLDAYRSAPFGVHIIPGFIEPNRCRAWVKDMQDNDYRDLGTVSLDTQGQLQNRITARRITEEVRAGVLRTRINRLVRQAFTGVISEQTGFNFDWYERPQVLRYRPGGHYDPHADAENPSQDGKHWIRNIDRDISLLIYLDDDYEGGALQFNHFNFSHQPSTGDLIFFPSDHRYMHQAIPLISGTRHVLVSWAAAQGARRVSQSPPEDALTI